MAYMLVEFIIDIKSTLGVGLHDIDCSVFTQKTQVWIQITWSVLIQPHPKINQQG